MLHFCVQSYFIINCVENWSRSLLLAYRIRRGLNMIPNLFTCLLVGSVGCIDILFWKYVIRKPVLQHIYLICRYNCNSQIYHACHHGTQNKQILLSLYLPPRKKQVLMSKLSDNHFFPFKLFCHFEVPSIIHICKFYEWTTVVQVYIGMSDVLYTLNHHI
jgi:hypothetical protein